MLSGSGDGESDTDSSSTDDTFKLYSSLEDSVASFIGGSALSHGNIYIESNSDYMAHV